MADWAALGQAIAQGDGWGAQIYRNSEPLLDTVETVFPAIKPYSQRARQLWRANPLPLQVNAGNLDQAADQYQNYYLASRRLLNPASAGTSYRPASSSYSRASSAETLYRQRYRPRYKRWTPRRRYNAFQTRTKRTKTFRWKAIPKGRKNWSYAKKRRFPTTRKSRR